MTHAQTCTHMYMYSHTARASSQPAHRKMRVAQKVRHTRRFGTTPTRMDYKLPQIMLKDGLWIETLGRPSLGSAATGARRTAGRYKTLADDTTVLTPYRRQPSAAAKTGREGRRPPTLAPWLPVDCDTRGGPTLR